MKNFDRTPKAALIKIGLALLVSRMNISGVDYYIRSRAYICLFENCKAIPHENFQRDTSVGVVSDRTFA